MRGVFLFLTFAALTCSADMKPISPTSTTWDQAGLEKIVCYNCYYDDNPPDPPPYVPLRNRDALTDFRLFIERSGWSTNRFVEGLVKIEHGERTGAHQWEGWEEKLATGNADWKLSEINHPAVTNYFRELIEGGADPHGGVAEDVLANATPNWYGGEWSIQELYKGTATLHFVPGNCEGGWGYNDDHTNLAGFLTDFAKTNDFTDAELVVSPIFRKFDNELLHQTNRITIAQTELNKVLGDGVPALSFAAGRNETGGVADNYNYNSYMANVESWPRFNRENGVKRLLWHHSDIKNIAYYFVYPLFEQLVSEGD